MEVSNKAFKAYDIRGVYPQEVNEELAYRVGRIFSAMFAAETAVVGYDVRLSGRTLADSLIEGLRHGGTNVIDIGQCGTEMIYFATARLQADGGIMITASHNPAEYNGMKLVRRGSRPIFADTGLKEIGEAAVSSCFTHTPADGKTSGRTELYNILPEYIDHLLSYINVKRIKPMKIVANPGNGAAGPVLKKLAEKLPCEFVYLQDRPDGRFPNGVPNPLLPQNRKLTSAAVKESGAALGVAWDGDFDRCFLFDEKGNFIEGYYIVGLLAEAFLRKNPGAGIMYDPRLFWNTEAIVKRNGGIPMRCRSGHAYMKEFMRAHDILYGGEMSSHHYFRDFFYCDSGMLPWLLIVEMLSAGDKTLSRLVGDMLRLYPCSGEINRRVVQASAVMEKAEAAYSDGEIDKMDGLSIAYADWRFNIRSSNTEPLLRLNVETRGNEKLLREKTAELLELIGGEEA